MFSNTVRCGSSLKSVSYTHLDVYKRQKVYIRDSDEIDHVRTHKYWASTEFRLFLLGLTGSDILVSRDAFTKLNGFVAVSYTHLDVYKRQESYLDLLVYHNQTH